MSLLDKQIELNLSQDIKSNNNYYLKKTNK